MRLLRFLAIFGAALGVVVVVLAFAEFSSPELGRALLERAGAATGMRLEADEFRLSLLRGLSLRAVRAKGTYPGGRYELTLDRIVFQHRLLPLLSGRLAVDRIRFEKPRAALVETGAAAPAGTGATALGAAAATSLALHVDQVAIEDGTIEVRVRGRAPLTVRGLDVSLRDLALAAGGGGVLGRLSGRGDFRADEIALPVTRVREAAGALRLAAGRLDADEVRFRTDEGRFQTRWSADLTRLPFSYTIAVEGRPLDVNAVLGAKGKGGLRAGAPHPGRARCGPRAAGPVRKGRAEPGGGHAALHALDRRRRARTGPDPPVRRPLQGEHDPVPDRARPDPRRSRPARQRRAEPGGVGLEQPGRAARAGRGRPHPAPRRSPSPRCRPPPSTPSPTSRAGCASP